MRAMDSNLRGFRSESGILIPNSRSSSLTTSGSANESRYPASNNDSSASGTAGFFETLFTMAMIRSLLSIRDLGLYGQKPGVLRHQLVEQHAANQAIACARKVHIIALAQPGFDPLPHGSGTAHPGAPVPKSAPILERHLPLHFDYRIQIRKRHAPAAQALLTIGRANHQDAGQRSRRAQPVDHLAEPLAVLLPRPFRTQRFFFARCNHAQHRT